MRVGLWLLKEKKGIKINAIAEMLDVDRRTLNNWTRRAQQEQKKVGRPGYRKEQKFNALLKVGREWKKQGCCGWRPVKAALRKEVPTRLLQETVAQLKLLQNKKQQARIQKNRLSVRVRYKNIYWSQDGAKFNRRRHQVIKDRGSFKILSVKTNKHETGEAIIAQLDRLKSSRGLPLVLGTDNGSMYMCIEVQEYFKKNKIIHLRSLPRTPQHNGAVECAIRELKEVARLNSCSLKQSSKKLNKNRLRASFLFKSATEMDDKMEGMYTENNREAFYGSCVASIKKCCAYIKDTRSKRMMERKTILATLENFGFIEINRGRLD